MKICLYPIPITGLSTRKPKKRNAMQLPHLSTVDAVFVTIIAGKTLSAAVAALPKPAKSTGFYVWLYSFARSEDAVVNEALAARFHTAQPGSSITVQPTLAISETKESK
jgi:hypothetical protein